MVENKKFSANILNDNIICTIPSTAKEILILARRSFWFMRLFFFFTFVALDVVVIYKAAIVLVADASITGYMVSLDHLQSFALCKAK